MAGIVRETPVISIWTERFGPVQQPVVFVICLAVAYNDNVGRCCPAWHRWPSKRDASSEALLWRVTGRTEPPFRFRGYGNLATIGRKVAIADFGWVRPAGFASWLLW